MAVLCLLNSPLHCHLAISRCKEGPDECITTFFFSMQEECKLGMMPCHKEVSSVFRQGRCGRGVKGRWPPCPEGQVSLHTW